MKKESTEIDLSNMMAESQTGGNAALKNLAVPAGLFFLQQAFSKKTPLYKNSENGEMMPASLYDRLLELKNDDETTRNTKKQKSKTKKNLPKTKRKSKKVRK